MHRVGTEDEAEDSQDGVVDGHWWCIVFLCGDCVVAVCVAAWLGDRIDGNGGTRKLPY